MTYKIFLEKIGIESDISFQFCDKNKIEDIKMQELLKTIALSFLSKSSKKKLLNLILNNELGDTQAMRVKLFIEEEFGESFIKYPVKQTLIKKFVDNFYDWIEVSCVLMNTKIILQVLKNIKSKNTYFWYVLIAKLYENKHFTESMFLIEKIKPLFNDNYLLEDLTLLEIKIIKKLDYLNDKDLLKRLCQLPKEIKSFKYDKIILLFECELLTNGKNSANLYKNHYLDISDFTMSELLNLYELSILLNNKELINNVLSLIVKNNIADYKGLKEYTYYLLLNYLNNNDKENFKKLRYDLEINDDYDFKHIDWYFRRNKKL